MNRLKLLMLLLLPMLSSGMELSPMSSSPACQERTINFKSGRLGIDWDDINSITHVEPNSQASLHSVKLGWIIKKINSDMVPQDLPYKEVQSMFQRAKQASTEFKVTFDTCQAQKAMTLNAGDTVEVLQEFETDSDTVTALKIGLRGTIREIDNDGDASVKFVGIDGREWVFKSNFHKLTKIESWCPRTFAEQYPNTCDHNWGNGDHHLTDYVYEQYKPLDEGDQVIIKGGATYYDGHAVSLSTRSYQDGLPGTIVRREVRNGECGVVIRFHGIYDNRQDNTMYPYSTIYWEEIPDGPLRRPPDDGRQLDLMTRPGAYRIGQVAQLDLQASGPHVIDEEVFIPRHELKSHLLRIYTHPNNGRAIAMDLL